MQSSSSTPSLGEGFGGGAGEGMPTPTATPIGGRSVASPAMIRILLTPAHSNVTPDEFEMMAGAIRRMESVRLADLPKSQSRGDSVPATSPLGKMGELHLSFITSYDPSHSFLAPFNLHRQVLGVLGLTTCNSQTSMGEVEHSPAALRQLHPSAVIHRVFAFDAGASRPQTLDLSSVKDAAELIEAEGSNQAGRSTLSANSGFAGRGTSGLVVFPAVRKDQRDVRFYLKTLLPEFVGSLLDGLDTIVKGLQGKSLETPRETLDGNLTSPAALSPASTKMMGAASSAASRASALFSSFSAEEKKSRERNSKASQSLPSSGPMGTGRYSKVKADYYLMAGDLWNALHTYDSCMTLLGKEKAMAGGQDAVWYASALEGWAVARFLVTRMGGGVEERAPCLSLPLGGTKEKDKEKSEFQFYTKAWSDVAEAYSQALAIYTKCLAPTSYLLESWKSITPETPRDYTHPLIHTSACLAYSRLLLAIWASGGWNGETFDQLLYGGVPPALAETTRPTLAVYTQHSTASGIQRSDVAAPASLSMTNSSTNGLKLLDQINLLSSLAAIFGALGFARKEAYTIRRLQALVVSLIASGIMLEKKETSMASQVIRTAGQTTFGTMTTMVCSLGAGENADSVLVLALQVCQTYGIDVQRMPLVGLDRRHILSRAAVDVKSGKRLSSPMLNRGRASWGHNFSPIQPSDWQKYAAEDQTAESGGQAPLFGWIQQQILILKDSLSVCEMLQDDSSLLFFAAILLRTFWPFLPAEDQMKLKEGIEKVQASLRTGGQETLLEYWGPVHILDDMQLSNQEKDLQEKSIKEAYAQSKETDGPWDAGTGRGGTPARSTAAVLLDDEEVFVSVTLSNPLSIPLEVERMRLDVARASSVGPRFDAVEAKSIVLPPSSHQSVRLSGRPHGEGKLLLRGVILKLPSCVERQCTWERTDGNNSKLLVKWQGDWDDRWTRTKRFGLDARLNNISLAKAIKGKGRAEDRFVGLQVISRVPRLQIQASGPIRNGNVVLFDGESKVIRLTLYNRTSLDVDYIRFDFDDDLKSEMLSLLAEGHLSPVDVHELEDDLIRKPFLSMDDKSADQGIKAGERKTFAFRVRAKLDVRTACIRIHYGNLSAARELGRDQFWTRTAQFRFHVRVLPVVAVDGLEVQRTDGKEWTKGREMEGSVVVGMRVHNLHPSSVTIDWQVTDAAASAVQKSLSSSSTTHIYFTVPRLGLSDDFLSQPIPNLIQRQFVLSQIKQTEEESRLVRARFWTRSALLDLIQTHQWKDEKMGISGEIGLSGLQIDGEHTLSMLRQQRLRIETSFDAEPVVKNTFVNLSVTIENASDMPIQARYRLVPKMQERLLNHIQCTNGHLHGRLPHYPLHPGQTSKVELGLCFLTSGTFAFALLVQDSKDEQTIGERAVRLHVL